MQNNNFSIIKLHNDYLLKRDVDKKRKNDCFRVSGQGQCLRKRIYERLGEPNAPLDLYELKIFEFGTMVHSYFQDMLEDMGILVSSEEEFRDDKLGIVGHADAIVKAPSGPILYDIKTCHANKCDHLDAGEQDEHYKMQLLTYVMLAQRKYKDLKEGRLFYYAKDKHSYRMAEYSFWLTDEWKEKILSELSELNRFWQRKEIPPAVPKQSWECQYCRYAQCPSNKLSQRKDDSKTSVKFKRT